MKFLRDAPFLRLLAVNLATGLAAAALGVGGLLLFDAYGLRSLMVRDGAGVLAVALLTFGFAVTFGSCAMGTAIMRMHAEP